MSPESETDNGWLEYRREILYRLDELAKGQRGTDERLDEMQTSLTELKAQRGVASWAGALFVTAGVSALVSWLTGRAAP